MELQRLPFGATLLEMEQQLIPQSGLATLEAIADIPLTHENNAEKFY